MTSTDLAALVRAAGDANPAWRWGEGITVGALTHDALIRTGQQMSDPQVAHIVVAQHAEARGIEAGRYAASLVFQRYCHRWCGIAAWCWWRAGVVLDVSAARAATSFRDGSPVSISFDRLTAVPGDGDALLANLVDEHLLPIARTMHQVAKLTPGNAMGNIAAALAGGARIVSSYEEPELLLPRAQKLLGRRLDLARAGRFRVVRAEGRARLFYDRATCCHWDEVPDGRLCTWCSKHSQDTRTQEFCRMLSEL